MSTLRNSKVSAFQGPGLEGFHCTLFIVLILPSAFNQERIHKCAPGSTMKHLYIAHQKEASN